MFSIIIPVFNREKLIIDTLNSIKNQSYRPIEIIIINDGSTDKTEENIHKWSKKLMDSDKIKFIYHKQKNSGPSSARNLGIKFFTGKYIQFFDSDDIMYPERLEKLVIEFKKNNSDIIFTGFKIFNYSSEDFQEKIIYGKPNDNLHDQLLTGKLWANPIRTAFKKELILKNGQWNEEMYFFEDREYIERALVKSKIRSSIAEPLAIKRIYGDDNLSSKLKTRKGRRFRILCEENISGNIEILSVSNPKIKSRFYERMISLGLRSSGRGWGDLAERCLNIAKKNPYKYSIKNKLKINLLLYGKKFPKLLSFFVFKLFRLAK